MRISCVLPPGREKQIFQFSSASIWTPDILGMCLSRVGLHTSKNYGSSWVIASFTSTQFRPSASKSSRTNSRMSIDNLLVSEDDLFLPNLTTIMKKSYVNLHGIERQSTIGILCLLDTSPPPIVVAVVKLEIFSPFVSSASLWLLGNSPQWVSTRCIAVVLELASPMPMWNWRVKYKITRLVLVKVRRDHRFAPSNLFACFSLSLVHISREAIFHLGNQPYLDDHWTDQKSTESHRTMECFVSLRSIASLKKRFLSYPVEERSHPPRSVLWRIDVFQSLSHRSRWTTKNSRRNSTPWSENRKTSRKSLTS